MKGRYKILMPALDAYGIPRTWVPEKRTAKRWHLFLNICKSLAADGLDYDVAFNLTIADDPHILITASGTMKRKQKLARCPRHGMVQALKPQDCAVRALEARWFLPESLAHRNANPTHWRNRRERYNELAALSAEHLHAELEYWNELERISGQRQHYKPGLTYETAYQDDEVAA